MMIVNGVQAGGGAFHLGGLLLSRSHCGGCGRFLHDDYPICGLSDRRSLCACPSAASVARQRLEGAAEPSFQEPGVRPAPPPNVGLLGARKGSCLPP